MITSSICLPSTDNSNTCDRAFMIVFFCLQLSVPGFLLALGNDKGRGPGNYVARFRRSNMAGVIRRSVDWLRTAWATQPVVFVSCVLGFSGNLVCMDFFLYVNVQVKPVKSNLIVFIWSAPCCFINSSFVYLGERRVQSIAEKSYRAQFDLLIELRWLNTFSYTYTQKLLIPGSRNFARPQRPC